VRNSGKFGVGGASSVRLLGRFAAVRVRIRSQLGLIRSQLGLIRRQVGLIRIAWG
jgi:hypothetical protein